MEVRVRPGDFSEAQKVVLEALKEQRACSQRAESKHTIAKKRKAGLTR